MPSAEVAVAASFAPAAGYRNRHHCTSAEVVAAARFAPAAGYRNSAADGIVPADAVSAADTARAEPADTVRLAGAAYTGSGFVPVPAAATAVLLRNALRPSDLAADVPAD